jgi:hypothetical protein
VQPAGAQEKNETQFTTKIGGKTSLGTSYLFPFGKIFIASYAFDGWLLLNSMLKLAVLTP